MSRITRRAKEARNRGIRGVLRWRPDLRAATRRPTLGLPASLKVLVGLLLVLALIVGAEGYLNRARRTSLAAIDIVSVDLQPGPHPAVDGGYVIGYEFEVDGIPYAFVARRTWDIEAIRSAKVCYDPADLRNQSLTKADEPCP